MGSKKHTRRGQPIYITAYGSEKRLPGEPFEEFPIIFSKPMVRAILAGEKTQTRRVIYEPCNGVTTIIEDRMPFAVSNENDQFYPRISPYGKPGDQLWVREAFSAWFGGTHWYEYADKRRRRLGADVTNIFYRATHHLPDDDQKWVPSIFMPRWASRITLELTNVRVERLHDISSSDVQAEGFDSLEAMQKLWQTINGKKHPWESNPWLWVLEFKLVKQKKLEMCDGV